MAGKSGKPGMSREETDDHLLLRARLVRNYSLLWSPAPRDWPVLFSVLIKPPKHPGDKWLVVCKATIESGDVVGFTKGSTLMATLANALQRVFTGHMDWKVETPYKPPNGWRG